MSDAILVVNAGSSSLKFAIYGNTVEDRIASGAIADVGGTPRLSTTCGGEKVERAVAAPTLADALHVAVAWIEQNLAQLRFAAVAHRVVHGGTTFSAPVVLDAQILRELEELDPLAPQHQPFNLAGARELAARFPNATAIACFDTAFHAGWDDSARRLALPRKFHEAGVRRYGFHGLSYEYLSARVAQLAPRARRIVLAHLGGGSSICAVRDGRSIECTMGFSVLDGLPMGTRCGALDPGAIFHLHRQYGLGFDEIEHMLYHESGMKGVSAIGSDMRALLASESPGARQAVELYAHHCTAAVGAMSATLGAIDALVFSGGIGANADAIRAMVCDNLEFLGIALEASENAANHERISTAQSRVSVFALATDEERVIAAHARELLRNA